MPAAQVPQVLEDCAAIGARNVHVYAAGFAETGTAQGRLLEGRVKDIAARRGLRVIGPNCMGVNVPSIGLQTLHDRRIPSGPVAFLSQSGGHALNLTSYSPAFGIGFSKVISYGNAAMMDSTDFLEYLAGDLQSKMIALYIEGVRDGWKLLGLVREMNRTRPVIVWKGGYTPTGARASASHTGSLAGSQAAWEAFFRQTGAVRVFSLEELSDMLLTFLTLPPLASGRTAVLLGGGGHSVTSADFSAREGLEVPRLSKHTRTALSEFIPSAGTSVNNPLDFEVVMRDPALFEKALDVIAQDPGIDALIVDHQLDMLQEAGPDAIKRAGDAMTSFAARTGNRKPLLAILESWGGDGVVNRERAQLQKDLAQAGIPVYRTFPRACRSLARFVQYHRWQSVSR